MTDLEALRAVAAAARDEARFGYSHLACEADPCGLCAALAMLDVSSNAGHAVQGDGSAFLAPNGAGAVPVDPETAASAYQPLDAAPCYGNHHYGPAQDFCAFCNEPKED
jgi:hypothetical protein